MGYVGTLPPQRWCSGNCQTLDMLASAQLGAYGGLANTPRTLGAGRHSVAATTNLWSVAYLEPYATPLTLNLTVFWQNFQVESEYPFSTGSTVIDQSSPVIAPVDCDRGFVAAWADFGNDGDELGVAIRFIPPGGPVNPALQFANSTVSGSQFDPDIVVTPSGVTVAWVDTSNATTAPDLRFRNFDTSLNPLSPEQTLAATSDSEADVALASLGGEWIAAWRDDSAGLETVRVRTEGGAAWTIGPPFLPAPVTSRPAITALDSTHALVVYAVGADPTDSGVADGSALMLAVLDTTGAPDAGAGDGGDAGPAPIVGTALVGTLSTQSQDAPTAVTVGNNAYVAWHTAPAPGDANGEENYLKSIPWSGSGLDLTQAEIPLPRWPIARLGDQRAPALAPINYPPSGALLAGWDDLGRALYPGEGAGDTAVEVLDLPVARGSEELCPQATADCDANPEQNCPTPLTTPQNCGGCRNVCSANAPICQSGQCIANCPTGQAFCYGSCIDVTSNPDECGGCGITCYSSIPNSYGACVNSACTFTCAPGYSGCPSAAPSACIDEQDDPNNCGSCGHTCPGAAGGTPTCSGGACSVACSPSTLTYCPAESACENLTDDPNNCGSCGHGCSTSVANATATCANSACTFSCNSLYSPCPTNSPTYCANERTDANNCGICGKVCPAPTNGSAICSGAACVLQCPSQDVYCAATNLCTNPSTDIDNCGTCGHTCLGPSNSTASCVAGTCGWACDANYVACGGTCIPDADTVHGAFVSATHGVSSSGCGTESEPCATISLALSNNPTKTIFYVDGGTYTEQVTVPAGVTIEGGWTDTAGAWSNCSPSTATIQAPSGDDAVIVASYTGASTLESLTIKNANTATAGESIYGVLATGTTTSLTLTDVSVSVASGGAGIVGSTGAAATAPAASCTASTGANGTAGTTGSPGVASYTSAGYQPATGGAGTSGTSGANGTAGGTGSTADVDSCSLIDGHCFDTEHTVTAASGSPGCASGGAGGGTGGTGGGASIGVFAWAATVDFVTASITTGVGGPGGAGGPAGARVSGSAGKAGALDATQSCLCGGTTGCTCNTVDVRGGAAGGTGGEGGAGGTGSGGSGGDSHCYVQGGGATVTWSGTCATGAAGAGGSPGGVAGNAGLHN